MSSTSQFVAIRLENHVLFIRLNRGERKNALSHDMYWTIADAIAGADQDREVRVILIHGSDVCFSSGNDLANFFNQDPGEYPEALALRFIDTLLNARKPIIAAVAGVAVGIGATMLLHCDLVFAADNSRFKLPFTQLGLVPEAASSLLLPRLCGHQKAMELLLLGESFDAETAVEIGLVNAISHESVVAHGKAVALRLAKLPPQAVQATKRLLREPLRSAIREAHDREQQYYIDALDSAEVAEALAAFMEKREARFD
ncbi:MAG: enoyl-CoA hydratase [Halieaceae bacterium]|nr:enoyl-CoA hydratase [Halieaceae bacterium]